MEKEKDLPITQDDGYLVQLTLQYLCLAQFTCGT